MILDTARLRKLALRLAYKNAMHECPEQLAQDLQQAAWVKYLTLTSYAHLWGDMYYAMLEELSRWLWQCKRGRGKDRLLTAKVELHDWTRRTLGTLDPEKILIAKEAMGREMWLQRNRDYTREYKRKHPKASTQAQKDYHLAYIRWQRGGKKPEEDPRYRQGAPGKLRAIKLGNRKAINLVQKYGVQVVKKALMPAVRRNQKNRKAVGISDPNSTKSKLTAGITY